MDRYRYNTVQVQYCFYSVHKSIMNLFTCDSLIFWRCSSWYSDNTKVIKTHKMVAVRCLIPGAIFARIIAIDFKALNFIWKFLIPSSEHIPRCRGNSVHDIRHKKSGFPKCLHPYNKKVAHRKAWRVRRTYAARQTVVNLAPPLILYRQPCN